MRINVPINNSIPLINTAGLRKGFSVQNVSAVDVYYSDDQRQLDSVSAANLPSVGHLLPASAPVQPPTVYPFFIGKLYCRAAAQGAQLEAVVYDVDVPCNGNGH